MKKKIVNVFLIATLLVTAVGTFVSCKDTNEDDFSTLQGQFNTQLAALEDALEAAIVAQTEALEAAQTTLQAEIDDLQSQITTLKGELDDLEEQINDKIDEINAKIAEIKQCECDPDATDQTLGTLQEDLETLEGQLETLQNDYTSKSSTLGKLVEDLASANKAIDDIYIVISNVNNTTDSLGVVTDSLEQRVAANEDSISYLLSQITRLDSISILVEALTGIDTRVTTLETEVGGLRDSLVTLWAQVYQDSAYIASLQTSVATLDSLYDVLKGSYDDLEARYEADSVAVWDNLSVVADSLTALSTRCDTLSTYIDKQITTVYSYIDTEIEDLQSALEEAIAKGDSVTLATAQAYTDSIESLLQDSIDALAVIVSDLSAQVKANTEAIEDLTDRVETLETEVLARYVTSIVVQGTENGCFGSFALPLGITSKVLMGYYGVYEPNDGTFPTISSASAYNGKAYLSDAQWAILEEAGISTETVEQGEPLAIKNEDGDIEAGTIYLTVNPTSVDFTDLTVSLENSKGEESGVKLSALEESDALLTFGYTRSADNGFYEAQASIPEAELSNVKIDITSGLKTELASTLKSVVGTSGSAINFTKLASLVYDQFNGILDANAVKTAWQDTTGTEYSVYSEYGVAATAFKPLSFKFLGNVNYSIPTINTLSYIDLGDFDELNIELNDVEIEYEYDSVNVSIEFTKVKFEITDVDTIIKFYYEHPISSMVWDEESRDSVNAYVISDDGTIKITTDSLEYNLNGFVVSLENGIEDMLTDLQNELNEEINSLLKSTVEGIIEQINDQLSSMIDDINGQLGSVNSLIDSFNDIQETLDSYIDKVNNYITRVNSAINRVNNYLTNANDYLQVALTYEGTTGQSILSNDSIFPNHMSAGETAVLHPTTYTGELAVPAVKKYVAVTNVLSGVTDATGAVGGDDELKALMIEANKSSNGLNEVLDGNTRAVGFTIPSSAKSGQIFEITYAALDYNGYTSYNKYYIAVK